MKISEVKFKAHPVSNDGIQAVVKFANGYGASIISGPMYYSRPECPYEIAVLDKNGYLCYDTPVTSDVCGYLTEDDANGILAQIEALPPQA